MQRVVLAAATFTLIGVALLALSIFDLIHDRRIGGLWLTLSTASLWLAYWTWTRVRLAALTRRLDRLQTMVASGGSDQVKEAVRGLGALLAIFKWRERHETPVRSKEIIATLLSLDAAGTSEYSDNIDEALAKEALRIGEIEWARKERLSAENEVIRVAELAALQARCDHEWSHCVCKKCGFPRNSNHLWEWYYNEDGHHKDRVVGRGHFCTICGFSELHTIIRVDHGIYNLQVDGCRLCDWRND